MQVMGKIEHTGEVPAKIRAEPFKSVLKHLTDEFRLRLRGLKTSVETGWLTNGKWL